MSTTDKGKIEKRRPKPASKFAIRLQINGWLVAVQVSGEGRVAAIISVKVLKRILMLLLIIGALTAIGPENLAALAPWIKAKLLRLS